MRQPYQSIYQPICGVLAGSLVILSLAQPVSAAATRITAIKIEPTQAGFELTFLTRNLNQRPQVFIVSRQHEWVADIVNAQLELETGISFQQENPAPGIQSVQVSQIDSNSVRVVVISDSHLITGNIVQQIPGKITLGIAAETPTASNQLPEFSSRSSPAVSNPNRNSHSPNHNQIPDILTWQ